LSIISLMYTLPNLPYSKDALNPHISANTLEFHHGKHHAGYIAKLNSSLEGHNDLMQYSIEVLLLNYKTAPESLHASILNNGGQHYNHSMYWESMSEQGGGAPTGELGEAIVNEFGSYEEFKTKFADAGATQFGSGWAWLSLNPNGTLAIDKTLNADTPLLHGKTPLLTMDVWEHAYYLDYQNNRPSYIEHFFEVINWDGANAKYLEAKSAV
jgi:superoxide dismutase, Fe-Mn family